MPTVADLIAFLEQIAPLQLAGDWDNVGLLLGDRQKEVQRIMTCLTVTPETAAEAIESGTQLIVTHHPIFFRPMKRLTADAPGERMLLSLAQAGVAVYSAHTAFDNAKDGINDSLARRLGLTDIAPLRKSSGPAQCKIVVFVPEGDLARVSAALFAAGAGHIGEYSQCSFRLPGTGTFFGSETAQPTVGQKGQREEVSEWRLEVVCPEHIVDRVVAAMRSAHSYEEPAYDVYPLRVVGFIGEGRIGRLPSPQKLDDLARLVRTQLQAPQVQWVGEATRLVQKMALVCGAGGDFLRDAIQAGADLFLTGELRFHDCLAAQANGLALLLPGHYASERFGMEELANRLQKQFPNLKVWASQREREPIRVV